MGSNPIVSARTMESIEDQYNRKYSQRENFFGDVPNPGIEAIKKFKESGAVLDIGAGDGRNSLFLAKQGFDVTALDISQVGIENIKKKAAAAGISIRTEIGAAQTYFTGERSESNFDVITSIMTLHYLTKDEALHLIREMQDHTNEGGLNVISTVLAGGDFQRVATRDDYFFPEHEQLRNLYADWEILKYKEQIANAEATHPDGTRMSNMVAYLIARKP